MSFTRAKAALSDSRFADLRWVPETGSTNTDVQRALTSEGAAGPGSQVDLVIVADHQRSGRGRLDRTWEAPPGASLLMSVGTTASVADEHRGLVLGAMSLAGAAAVADLCEVELRVKWPNDLVWTPGGGQTAASLPGPLKVAGILAEAVALPGPRTGYVVGIGVNCNWGSMPPELEATATSLDLLAGAAVDREDLAVGILEGFTRRLASLEEAAVGGTVAVDLLEEARGRSATLGADVVVRTPGGELRGRAVDIDDDGALLVDTGGPDERGAPERVTVGDVVHLRPA